MYQDNVLVMSPKLGDILCLLRFLLFLLFFLSFFRQVYQTHFSETTEWKSMKLHRNVKRYE